MVTGPAGATKFARYALSPTQPVTKFAQHGAFLRQAGTKLAQHAIKRQFSAISRALGEFCHAQADNRPRRAKKVTPKTPHQPNKVTIPNFARNSIT